MSNPEVQHQRHRARLVGQISCQLDVSTFLFTIDLGVTFSFFFPRHFENKKLGNVALHDECEGQIGTVTGTGDDSEWSGNAGCASSAHLHFTIFLKGIVAVCTIIEYFARGRALVVYSPSGGGS
jgi:hypothetical protein